MSRLKASMNVDQWTRWALAGTLVGLAVAAIYWRASPIRESDPDRYFHLEMARRTAETGHLRAVEEIAELTPGEAYHNPYWFFTSLSALGYRIAGEPGVLAFGFLCALGILLLLLWVAHENLSIGISMLLICGVLICPDAMNRFFLYRPHLLSMLIFSFAIVGVLRGNRYLTFGCGLLHAISYQAPFLLAAVFILALGFFQRQAREFSAAAAGGLLGLMVGMVLHPYFPANLNGMMKVLSASTPTQTVAPLLMPMEFGAVSIERVVMDLSFFLLPLILLIIRIVPQFRKTLFKPEFKAAPVPMLWLTACLALFWALSFVTARAIEYVIPLAIFGWIFFIREWKNPATQGRFLIAGMVLCLPLAWKSYVLDERIHLSPQDLGAVIRSLPESAGGAKVLNMDWSHGALILNIRPGYRIVDYGDPRMLAKNRPDVFDLRQQLARGLIADPYGVVRFAIGADYVLTFAGPFQMQMDESPHFRKYAERELSETPGHKVFIYQAAPQRLPLQVKKYDFQLAATANQAENRRLTSEHVKTEWKPWGQLTQLTDETRTTFVQLGKGSEAVCTLLRPRLESQPYIYGATQMAVGGAGKVKIYFNGARFFNGELGKKGLRETEWLLPLPKPLTAKDEVLVEVCGLESQWVTGFTASFFSSSLLTALCDWKYGSGGKFSESKKEWQYETSAGKSCLAPYATAALTKRSTKDALR